MDKFKWILWPVIITTIILPAGILLVYKSYLTGSVFSFSKAEISTNPDDWDAFGSLISGLFTLSGSLATIAALLFAFKQNEKLSKEADKRSREDKETAKKNEDFMSKQIEKLNFEKFTMHKDMFHNLLSMLEKDASDEMRFYSKSLFYTELFPRNSFNEVATRISIDADEGKNLKAILQHAEGIQEKIKDSTYIAKPSELLNDILTLKQSLTLEMARGLQDGDLYTSGGAISFNIINIQMDLYNLGNILTEICIFTQINKNFNILMGLIPNLLVVSLVEYANSLDGIRETIPAFPLHYVKSKRLDAMVSLYNFFITLTDDIKDEVQEINLFIVGNLSPQRLHTTTSPNGYIIFLKRLLSILKKKLQENDQEKDLSRKIKVAANHVEKLINDSLSL